MRELTKNELKLVVGGEKGFTGTVNSEFEGRKNGFHSNTYSVGVEKKLSKNTTASVKAFRTYDGKGSHKDGGIVTWEKKF